MQSYTSDEKDFLKMIVTKTVETKQFFQLLVSENFFKEGYRPFMLVDSPKKRVFYFLAKEKNIRNFLGSLTS